ncbi:MAG: hypothetical protein V4682_00765 [Patescibacteria group bacterium]
MEPNPSRAKLLQATIILGSILAAIGIVFFYPVNTEKGAHSAQEVLPTDWFNGIETPLFDSLTDDERQAMWDKRQALSEALKGYAIEATFLPEAISVEYPGGTPEYGPRLFKVGTITNGELRGETLYIEEEPGMGGAYYGRAIMRDGVVVTLNSQKFSFPYEYDMPYEISIPGTPHKLRKGDSGTYLFGTESQPPHLFSTAEGMPLYRADGYGQCIMAELPDHTAVAYDLDIPFVIEESGMLTVKLLDGRFFEGEYEFFDYGCGAGCRLLKYVDGNELNLAARAQPVATDLKTGETIYAPTSYDDARLRELYEDENTLAYFRPDDNWEHEPVNKYTYEEFLGHRPLLYWKDPWGKWVEFKNKRFSTAAEKCKPVIYLYPEKPGDFHVEVAPNGGFTKTIPEYKDGWDVRALPDGTLTEIATGIEYPYLYWSGMGINYPTIKEGWVVAREDVSSFLDEKLYRLGLEGKEIADFKEYWVERLSERPYYKITFLPERVFSQLAPLSVAPETPDTTIRVMMTAQGTDTEETLPEQTLPRRPYRGGFVLVEWGGALLY